MHGIIHVRQTLEKWFTELYSTGGFRKGQLRSYIVLDVLKRPASYKTLYITARETSGTATRTRTYTFSSPRALFNAHASRNCYILIKHNYCQRKCLHINFTTHMYTGRQYSYFKKKREEHTSHSNSINTTLFDQNPQTHKKPCLSTITPAGRLTTSPPTSFTHLPLGLNIYTP